MSGIEDLRQRVMDAEKRFGLNDAQYAKDSERLIFVMNAVEERIREQQDDIARQAATIAKPKIPEEGGHSCPPFFCARTKASISPAGDSPRRADATYFLARAHMRAEDYASARVVWSSFEREFPGDSRAHEAAYYRGWLYLDREDFEAALPGFGPCHLRPVQREAPTGGLHGAGAAEAV